MDNENVCLPKAFTLLNLIQYALSHILIINSFRYFCYRYTERYLSDRKKENPEAIQNSKTMRVNIENTENFHIFTLLLYKPT